MSRKDIRINSDFLSLVIGFVVGFLISFAICWNTIIYIVKIILEK